MLKNVDHEIFCEQFSEMNPGFICGRQGAQVFAVAKTESDPTTVLIMTGGDYYCGSFSPAEFDRFRSELGEIQVEELVLRFGPQELREIYYGCSQN